MSDTAPAGWYPAPHAGNELRYWDGTAWHAAPPYLPAGASSPAGTGAPVVPPPGAPGAPFAAPPGYPPYAGGPIPPARPQGLAVAALVLGIAAFVSAWIPFLGLLVALVGAVIGVMALVRRQPKGLAVTGTVLSGLGLVWALVVTISLSALIWTAPSSFDDAETSPESSAPTDDGFDSLGPESGPGSLDDPLPLPYVSGTAAGDDYSVDARLVSDDATDEVVGWDTYNGVGITGSRFVLVEMTVTGLDPDGTEAAYASYDLSLATQDGTLYPSAFVVHPDDRAMLSDAGTIAEGETVTGLVAYLVPEDATDLLLSDYADYYEF